MTNKVTILLLLILLYACTSNHKPANDVALASESEDWIMNAQSYIPDLSGELQEISGLLIYDSLFWGFNDSGGKAILYGFDANGTVVSEIKVGNTSNRDWESIAQDEQYFYVGDFGNNMGKRKDLKILKVDKSVFNGAAEQTVTAETISFNYSKQTRFAYPNLHTPFDCEALISYNNALYIFSKNWVEQTTCSYKIPAESGSYTITALDTFNVEGLITGADLSSDQSTLALLGYENYHAFVWLFTEFEGDHFFGGKQQRIRLPNLDGAQTEGICFVSNDKLLISCERTNKFSQQVFLLDLKDSENGAF